VFVILLDNPELCNLIWLCATSLCRGLSGGVVYFGLV